MCHLPLIQSVGVTIALSAHLIEAAFILKVRAACGAIKKSWYECKIYAWTISGRCWIEVRSLNSLWIRIKRKLVSCFIYLVSWYCLSLMVFCSSCGLLGISHHWTYWCKKSQNRNWPFSIKIFAKNLEFTTLMLFFIENPKPFISCFHIKSMHFFIHSICLVAYLYGRPIPLWSSPFNVVRSS